MTHFKNILLLFFLLLCATVGKSQILPFIDASYKEAVTPLEIPQGIPLKGHYVFASAQQHTLGIMELGAIMFFRPDSTVSMKLVGYEAVVIDIEATYKVSPGQVLSFQMISVSNPALSEHIVHFFEVPIYYSVSPVENNTSQGYFIVLAGEHAMREHKKGMQQDKTGFQFTLSYMK